jgi:nucleoside-diphosphate kinase
MSTRIFESAHIAASSDEVWNVIRHLDFSFSPSVAKCEVEGKSADEVGSIRNVTYTDKTFQRVKLVELSESERKLSYELIESIPAASVLSVVHTWRLRRVTHDNSTLFEFTSDFSKDASDAVTQDSKYKKLELFKDLREALSKGKEKKEQKRPMAGVAGTNTERTFIAVKPDGVHRGLVGEIIGRFEKRGFKLVALKMLQPSAAKAAGHYDDLKTKPFFPALVKFFSSGPVVGMVWEGNGSIAVGRQMLGATNPQASAPGTIRGDFAIVTGRNVCHGSDSPAGAAREIPFWFTAEELVDWTPSSSGWIYE